MRNRLKVALATPLVSLCQHLSLQNTTGQTSAPGHRSRFVGSSTRRSSLQLQELFYCRTQRRCHRSPPGGRGPPQPQGWVASWRETALRSGSTSPSDATPWNHSPWSVSSTRHALALAEPAWDNLSSGALCDRLKDRDALHMVRHRNDVRSRTGQEVRGQRLPFGSPRSSPGPGASNERHPHVLGPIEELRVRLPVSHPPGPVPMAVRRTLRLIRTASCLHDHHCHHDCGAAPIPAAQMAASPWSMAEFCQNSVITPGCCEDTRSDLTFDRHGGDPVIGTPSTPHAPTRGVLPCEYRGSAMPVAGRSRC